MRVNIVVGARINSLTVADALGRLGTDTVIYTSAPPSRFRSNGRRHVTSFVPMPVGIAKWLTGWRTERWDPADSVFFDRLAALKMRECDVLHAWAGYALKSGESVKRQGGVFVLERPCPHVDAQEALLESEADVLGVPYRRKPAYWLERSRAEYELADFIVVPSDYSRRSFIERGVDPAKIVKAPLDFPALYAGRPEPRTSKEFVVGTLGGSLLRKGFLYLLEAWKRLALPNARLLIKASESELRRSPILREYLDSCPNVEVLGYVKDISSFYRRCDVFCLASIDDGFGQAMLEALSNGVPSIVTENVGAAELLAGTDAGFVIPIRDADAIARNVLRLYEDPSLRSRMGQAALELSERLFHSEGRYFESIRQLYSDAMQLRSSRQKGVARLDEALSATP
jgi:glycosyltransferase involved in cell wall biosynthesis